jgi:predicted permease
LGKTLRLNGQPVTVIGVGPVDFKGTVTGFEIDFFMPLRTAATVHPIVHDHLEQRDARNFFMFARLRPGVTLEQARSGLSILAANLAEEYPETNAERGITLLPAKQVRMHPELDAMLYPAAGFLMMVVLLVLLVACSNLASLLLIRAASRRREMAVRLALGAGRGRIVAQLLTESMILGLAGGGVGLLFAFWAARGLTAYRPPIPVVLSLDLHLDLWVLGFTALLSLLTGMVFGLAPALTASRQDIAGTIKGASASMGFGCCRSGMKSFLVAAQVAVSLILLVGAGLFLRSLLNGRQVDVGFETERTALATVDVSLGGYGLESAGRDLFDRYCERIEGSPDVDEVALASRVPLGLGRTVLPVFVPGIEPGTDDALPSIDYAVVDEAYFSVMGVPILRGSNFSRADTPDSPTVVIVSETMAKRAWKRLEVVGERIMLGRLGEAVPAEVIGVARDTKVRSLHESPQPYIYFPFIQRYTPRMSVVARANVPPAGIPETFRRELQALDVNIPLLESKSMAEHLGLSLYLPSMLSALLALFGAVALVLASIGLYSVLAFMVVQRNREMGIRVALGAEDKQILWMILREGLLLTLTGIAIGLILSRAAMQPLSGLLIGVSPADPVTFAGVALVLGTVALFAIAIPARRAAKLDPMKTLRCE